MGFINRSEYKRRLIGIKNRGTPHKPLATFLEAGWITNALHTNNVTSLWTYLKEH